MRLNPKISVKNLALSAAVELAGLVFALAVFLMIQIALQDFKVMEEGHVRFVAVFICLLPTLFFYILLRLIFSPLFSLAVVCSLLYVMGGVNELKTGLTGEPLTWTDISATSNFSVVKHYISLTHVIGIALCAFFMYVAFKLKKFQKISWKRFLVSLIILVAIAPLVFYPYAKTLSPKFSESIFSYIADSGLKYYSWNLSYNVEMAGLPLHLIQTSQRTVLEKPNESETLLYANLIEENPLHTDAPENIIFILCEACWHDHNNFYDHFDSLRTLGFEEFRTIAPTFERPDTWVTLCTGHMGYTFCLG